MPAKFDGEKWRHVQQYLLKLTLHCKNDKKEQQTRF
jgi:hypothetical protein